jgi:serine/threonine protein kinase
LIFPAYPTQQNKFVFQNYLGNGAFGHVLQAKDVAVNAQRAVKLIYVPDQSRVQATIREAQALEKCRHDNIVHMWEAGILPVRQSALSPAELTRLRGLNHQFFGTPTPIPNPVYYIYISMELLPRGSVETFMQANFISVRRAVGMVQQASIGLAHAHEIGIVHSDLKPGNFMCDQNGNIKLSDFGLAYAPALIMATPNWYCVHAAPELFAGGSPSFQTDIYAMGVSLYRLVNNVANIWGQVPALPNLPQLVQAGKFPDRSTYQPHVPLSVKRIANKAMNIAPVKRHDRATDLVNALNRLRFNLDWEPINPDTLWQVPKENITLGIELAPRNQHAVIFKKNGRRVTQHCSCHQDLPGATVAMFKIIQDTTLR